MFVLIHQLSYCIILRIRENSSRTDCQNSRSSHKCWPEQVVKAPEGEVVAPGDLWVLAGKGLPRAPSWTGGSASRGDLFIRFKVDFPRKLARPVSGDSVDAKKALEDLRALLGQKSQNGSAGGDSGLFSRGWWSRGGSGGVDSGNGVEKPVLVAQRASAAQERALATAEQRQTSERERTEGF